MTAAEHIEAALAILEPQRFDAHDRYEHYAKRRTVPSAAMRRAWDEYRTLADVVNSLNDALLTLEAKK